jgi:hypothetical protein
MHNPFFGETFKDAMAKVFSSYDRNPREMHIVYMFPWEHECSYRRAEFTWKVYDRRDGPSFPSGGLASM